MKKVFKIMLCGHNGVGRGYRGCCYICYQKYMRQVILKKTTWEQLEKEGKTSPALKDK